MGLLEFFIKVPTEGDNKAPSNKEGSPEVVVAPTAETTILPSVAGVVPAGQKVSKGVIDPKILESLVSALDSNNQPGFDYAEFKQSFKAMENLPIPESDKYKTTFTMASSMDKTVTVDKLINSCQFYLDVLNKEKVLFENAAKMEFEKNVTSRQHALEDLDMTIQDKSDQIVKLTDEIRDSQKKKADLQGEISQWMSNIEATKLNYEETFNSVSGSIKSDMEKIKLNIGKVP